MAKSKKPNRKRSPKSIQLGAATAAQPAPLEEQLLPAEEYRISSSVWLGLAALLLVFTYSYWPTLVWIEDTWRNEPDYSHGYIVPILAAMIAWHRFDSFPGFRPSCSVGGLSLLAVAIAMRFLSRLFYMDFLDGWSILPWVAGCVWVLAGPAATRWATPAILFLFFLVPLPYQAESLLSWKLQGVATGLSTTLLRALGMPAVSEGHVIWIGDQRLLVEQACSGMRIFVGIGALAFFWAATVKRSWLDQLVLLVGFIPLAILVNSLRITSVGLLYQIFDGPDSRATIHDFTGYLMIPLGFLLIWAFKIFWENAYRPVRQLNARDFVVPAT